MIIKVSIRGRRMARPSELATAVEQMDQTGKVDRAWRELCERKGLPQLVVV